eukprot:GCRY01003522.1.p1 GENE.GCRY01003522.1~~GCRY01003522.1.p1  ORF type:complete len:344 (+),score=61.16 GCRY01003522.1:190-1221(+)
MSVSSNHSKSVEQTVIENDEDVFGSGRSEDVSSYEKIGRIGEGTYGVVYKVRHKKTKQIFALKRMKVYLDHDGFSMTSLREIKILKRLIHPNVVELIKVAVGRKLDSIFLVYEFCNTDLACIMENMKHPFSESEIKSLLVQLLKAVAYLHDSWVIHRDLKMSNLLYTNKGELKVADFGLARTFGAFEKMTLNVVTLWYRAPELLLGAKEYTQAVDMWSVGCIFGEFLSHQPLFPGNSELNQLGLIFRLLGTPTPRIWPEMFQLPGVNSLHLPDQPYNDLKERFPYLSDSGVDLLDGLLTYDPTKRLTAKQALHHPYLTSETPLPKPAELMPTFPELGMLRYKR